MPVPPVRSGVFQAAVQDRSWIVRLGFTFCLGCPLLFCIALHDATLLPRAGSREDVEVLRNPSRRRGWQPAYIDEGGNRSRHGSSN